MDAFSYDVVQYNSYPYKQTHPNQLRTLGKIFGLNAKPFEEAKILELGCASGGNIIPMALSAPKAKFVGIDLSQKQIDEGQKTVKALNLSNLTLQKRSIMDLNASDGQFDYIICHGVFSWVDHATQEKIFTICKENLTANGIAFISYNALPGWNMVKSIREMMQYHIRHITDPQEKSQQSRSILQFILNGIKDNQTPYAKFLESEIQILSNQHDSYLYHEHLEEHNTPLYFYDFIERARAHGVDYLADSDIAQMFAGNLPANVAKEFLKINDIVQLGQYMDFVRNQRFRQTLLCHAVNKIDRNITMEKLRDFQLSFVGTAEGSEDQLAIDTAAMCFKGTYITLTVSSYIAKMALWILSKENKPISFSHWIEKIKTATKVQNTQRIESVIETDCGFIRLVLGGMVQLSLAPTNYAIQTPKAPKTTSLIMHQLSSQTVVTNLRHEMVRLSDIDTTLLKLCTGTIDREQLPRAFSNSLIKNNIPLLKEDGQRITQHEEIHRRAEYLVKDLLVNFSRSALLVNEE